MKPHPRIRKTIKWGGAAVTVLLVVVWIGSAVWTVTFEDYGGCRHTLGIAGGDLYLSAGEEIIVADGGDGDRSGLNIGPGQRWHAWRTPRLDFGSLSEYGIELPLSGLVGVAALGTVAALILDIRARRRARLNLCSKCNYDRAGIAADAKCPECGAGAGAPRT